MPAHADGPVARELTIVNRRGLHARASARFVRLAETFDATVTVSKDGHSVDGTSIMGLLMLSAVPGSVIHVAAVGHDAAQAVEAIAALVADGFGEDRPDDCAAAG